MIFLNKQISKALVQNKIAVAVAIKRIKTQKDGIDITKLLNNTINQEGVQVYRTSSMK
jgi:hypothetical protein